MSTQVPSSRARQSPGRFQLQAERLGPLPLVNHFIGRLGLEPLLERHLPTTDKRTGLSSAKALGVLLRSIIVEREPIYRQQETVRGFAPGMYGLNTEQMERLNDDQIGRALDRLFDADRAALLTACERSASAATAPAVSLNSSPGSETINAKRDPRAASIEQLPRSLRSCPAKELPLERSRPRTAHWPRQLCSCR